MKIESKPPELLQAQAALYAEGQIEHKTPGRGRAILANLGEVALYTDEAPEELTYPLPVRVKGLVDGEIAVVAEKGTHKPMFARAEYADLLKDPANRQVSRNLAEMIESYRDIQPVIESMGITGLGLEEAREHPNFIGHGGSNMAFRIKGEVDGREKDLVAIVDQNDIGHSLAKVNGRAINLSIAKGLSGFEQGVAVSYDPPVVIAEMAQGKGMADMSYEERQAIPREHWDTLTDNVEQAVQRGILIDPNTDNVFYDPDKGFTIIDFRIKGKKTTIDELRETTAGYMEDLRAKVLTEQAITRN